VSKTCWCSVSLVAVSFVAVSFVATAPADEKPAAEKPAADGPDAAALFAQLDLNKDGQLTADEIPADRKRLFERLVRVADKNKDDKLDAEEFAAGLAPRERTVNPEGAEGRTPERIFKRLDANGDGKVTLDEVPDERREGFKLLIARGDKDGDGALSKEEFIKAMGGGEPSKPAETKPADTKTTDAKPADTKPADAKQPDVRPGVQRLFTRLDKNGDGKVTLDEVPDAHRPMIERSLRHFDKDGDKALSLEEFSAAMEHARPGEGQPPAVAARPAQFGGNPRGFMGLFGLLDADHDGKLSSDEISAAPERLRTLDKNGDGTVSPDEIMAFAREQAIKADKPK
jgi:Ca2+-binding EF-hand superfamily protein